MKWEHDYQWFAYKRLGEGVPDCVNPRLFSSEVCHPTHFRLLRGSKILAHSDLLQKVDKIHFHRWPVASFIGPGAAPRAEGLLDKSNAP